MGWKTNQKNNGRAYLSREFVLELRRKWKSQRAFAAEIGVERGVLVRWLEGVNRVQVDDPRIAKMAESINFPKDKIHEVIGGA